MHLWLYSNLTSKGDINMTSERRKRAIRRRRIFIACCLAVLIAATAAIVGVVALIKSAFSGDGNDNITSNESLASQSEAVDSSEVASSEPENSLPETVTRGEYTLDASYSELLLVNGENPLPENYAYGEGLTTIDFKYHNGQLDQINEKVWPYMKAMIEAAWGDGVELYVWSPYRSYETQKMLFENQVNRCLTDGVTREQAEQQAATVVARPGTSEHHTGLAADFNMASDRFESTEMYRWMCENAEDYGFILRYPADKTDITGVIYESWHWRFVGINTAKEINELGVTLEEYLLMKSENP